MVCSLWANEAVLRVAAYRGILLPSLYHRKVSASVEQNEIDCRHRLRAQFGLMTAYPLNPHHG
jgi:hypothetical protein